ncbi:MAG TPA: DUF4912 domain-containing protein [Blastocatellia bacterium]
MLVLRPSSPLGIARPVRAFTLKAVEAKARSKKSQPSEPFIDEGLPIPEAYEVDLIRALLQDPFRIFIYWKVREESLKALTRYFSEEEAATFRVVLKLTELKGRHEAFFDVQPEGRYWMTVFPDRDYEFEIGVRSPQHGYIRLIRSNRVRAPRGTVSPLSAAEPEYRVTPHEFRRIMEASGFSPEQSMRLTLAATDHAEGLAEQAIERLPESLRQAIPVAAAGDALSLEMIERMPEPLRSELMKLYRGSGGLVASAGLMHYLPEMMRQYIEDESEWIEDRIHPLHIAPKYFAGGSEQIARPSEKVRWPALPQIPGSFQPDRR